MSQALTVLWSQSLGASLEFMNTASVVSPLGPVGRNVVRPARRPKRSEWAWVLALFIAVCFEGLGRKFLPQVPSTAFYFMKDVVLLLGLAKIGIRKEVSDAARWLMGGWLSLIHI